MQVGRVLHVELRAEPELRGEGHVTWLVLGRTHAAEAGSQRIFLKTRVRGEKNNGFNSLKHRTHKQIFVRFRKFVIKERLSVK